LVKPGIKRLVNEIFSGVHYLLTQQEYDELVAEEFVARRFAMSWDALILPFKVNCQRNMADDRMISRQITFKAY
jgi:hypothetical protein